MDKYPPCFSVHYIRCVCFSPSRSCILHTAVCVRYIGGVYVFTVGCYCSHLPSSVWVHVCVHVCVCVKNLLVWVPLGGEPGSWRSGHTRWICSVQRSSLEGKQRNGVFDWYFWQCVSVSVCICVLESETMNSVPEKRDYVFVYNVSKVQWALWPSLLFFFNFRTPSV